MNQNASSFGAHAAAYAAGRPSYPDTLFDWIVSEAPGREAVWDCATGNGQAARSLADRFELILATDFSEAQIAQAAPHPKVRYSVAPAEASGLEDASVDAVTVATALHWFDFTRYWDEVRRVAKPGALFCGWTYGLVEANDTARSSLLDPVEELVKPYWAKGNWLAMEGYPRAEIQFPFEELATPAFEFSPDWDVERLIAFLGTWSAVTRARDDGLGDALDRIFERARSALAEQELAIRLPLAEVAGRVG